MDNGCRWSTQRIVFGKPLTAQPVIRAKLASMLARVEACQNWLESITHQMNNVSVTQRLVSRVSCALQMSYNEMSSRLAGPIGLLKQFVYFFHSTGNVIDGPTPGLYQKLAEKPRRMLPKSLVEEL